MRILGLTGMVGSGKSLAATYFADLGALILDADELSREVVLPGSKGLKLVSKRFGPQILDPKGNLNRKALRELVFSDSKARDDLNAIIHPLVRALFLEKKASIAKEPAHKGKKLLLYVVPLLFESADRYPEIEQVIVVTAPKSICIQRTVERDGCSEEIASSIYNSQLNQEEKIKRSHFELKNEATPEDLRRQVNVLYQQLTSSQ